MVSGDKFTIYNKKRTVAIYARAKRGLPGIQGAPGISAYQVWLNAGNVGTEAEYIASLKGAKGDAGPIGPPGIQGPQGDPGTTDYNDLNNLPDLTLKANVTDLTTKVDKVATVNTLYGVNGSGNQYSYPISQASATSSIAQRSSGGTLAVGTPTSSAHATTKTYVDNAVAPKANTSDLGTAAFEDVEDLPVSTAQQTALDAKATKIDIPQTSVPYRTNAGSGEPHTSLPVSSGTTVGTLALRTATGAISAANATEAYHLVRKDQMDAADALKVSKAGDTMTGALTVSGGSNAFRHVRSGKDIGYGVGAVPDASVYNFTDEKEIFRIFADGSGFIIGGDVGGTSGTNPRYLKGTGFPNGVVSAPVGSTYIDTAATNGAIEWKKATGTGNTGWAVSVGDTGWRNVKSLTDEALNPEAGLRVRRVNNIVYWDIVAVYTPSSNYVLITNIPSKLGASFAPYSLSSTLITGYGSPNTSRGVAIGRVPSEGVKLVGSGNFWAAPYYATFDPWPTTLPGTAI